MKVLVVNPPNAPFTDSSLLIEPIDVLGIATYVRSLGHEVVFKDMDRAERSPSSIATELKEMQPDYTIVPFDYHIPLFQQEAITGVHEIAKIATQCGSVPIIGGRMPNQYPQKFIEGTNGAVIIGEMEPALQKILSRANKSLSDVSGIFYYEKGVLNQNARTHSRINLDALPIPDRSFVDTNNYIEVRTLLSSRGCVEKCGFCPVPEFWGNWKKRSAQNVVDELEYLVESFDAKKVLFLDDNATVSNRRMQTISEQIMDRHIDTTLGCLGTVSQYDPATIDTMARAGFRWIHYGAEMASQPALDYMGKRITVDQIRTAILGTKEAGLRVRTSWIFDAPYTTEEALDHTIELILETEPHEIRAHYLALRAGTRFAREFGTTASAMSSQYIHASSPHSSINTIDPQIITSKISKLTSELATSGYLVIHDPAQFKLLSRQQINDPDLKLISFCPMRYGIGWRSD